MKWLGLDWDEGPFRQTERMDIYREHVERLLKQGIAGATLDDIEAESMRQVDAATATAKASPPPSIDDIEKNVWADGGSAWRN